MAVVDEDGTVVDFVFWLPPYPRPGTHTHTSE